MTARSRVVAAAALAALAALLMAVPDPGGRAEAQSQPAEQGAGSLRIDVTRLEGLVTLDDDLTIRAHVTNEGRSDREDLRLLVTMHRQPIGRFNYQQAVDNGVLGDIVHAFTYDLGEVPGHGSRTVELSQTAAELGLARPAGQDGVYPLRIQLQSGGQLVHEVITNLVYAPTAVELPVAVSLLLPVVQPPSRDGHGVFTRDGLVAATAPGGSLQRLASVLAERPDLPVTLAVDGLTLEEVADLASGFMHADDGTAVARSSDSAEAQHAAALLGTLREVADRPLVHVLAFPYAFADIVAFERHGLGDEVVRYLSDGLRSVESATGERPLHTVLWPPDGLDARTHARVRDLGMRWLVLSERYLELPGPRGARSPSPVRGLRTGHPASATALVPDPWLEETLIDRTLPAPLLAQRILGELATVYFEVPSIAERGVLLAPPLGTAVDPDLVATLTDDLAAAPFAELVTLATLSQQVAPAGEPVRLTYPESSRAAELPPSYLEDLQLAGAAMQSLRGVLVDDQVTPARFEQILQQAGSAHYRDDRAAGRALLRTVTGTMEALHDAVEIPRVPPVTLTSVEGQLPVTIRSEADVPLRVLLHLRTASYEVQGGPVRELILEPGQSRVLTFQVRALRPGRTDGVQLVVTDVDETVQLAESTVVVRSTTFSVAGLVVTVGAALFLLTWGVREAARRRRPPLQAEEPRADRPSEPAPSTRAR